jgi:hypothetical protein
MSTMIDSSISEVISQLTLKPIGAFEGTRQFINQTETLSPYRTWLGLFFDALASKDRDALVKALHDVRTKFKRARLNSSLLLKADSQADPAIRQ